MSVYMFELVRMGIILEIPFSFILIFIRYCKYVKSRYCSFAYSIITIFSFVFLSTELLSIFKAISIVAICTIWTVLFATLLFINRKEIIVFFKNGFKKKWIIQRIRENIVNPMYDFILVALLLTLFMSLFTVVNNGDSMIYHLPRVLHWLQDGSVNYYYVQDIRQIYSPVLSEYTLLHIFALSGNDVLFNVLQWFAYGTIAVLLNAIFYKLSVSKQASLLGVLLFLTMPMAIAQTMTTQVDLLGTMWVVIFLYLMIDLAQRDCLTFEKDSVLKMCMTAGCVGLAYITKTNACIPMALVCVWFLIHKLRNREKTINLIKFVLLAGVVVSCIILSGLIRNLLYQGAIFSSEFGEKVLILTWNPKYVFVNIYKNISMELMQFILAGVDSGILQLGGVLAGFLGIDINDPLIGYGGNDYYSTGTSPYYYFHHDHASNPLVMIMAILSLLYILIIRIKNKERNKNKQDLMMGLSIIVFLGFIVSAAIIRWQPWVTRLLLPSQVLLIIPIVYALQLFFSRIHVRELVLGMLMMAAFITSINPIMYNIRVPLKNLFANEDRIKLYFYYHEDDYDGYRAVIDEISEKGYHNIGLGTLNFEYVLWKELRERDCTLEHVPIEDGEEYNFSPDCIIVFNQYEEGDIITFNGLKYQYHVLCQSGSMKYGLFSQ